MRPGMSIGDTGTGMLMAITILGALYKRRETGEGHQLQVAMQTLSCTMRVSPRPRQDGQSRRTWWKQGAGHIERPHGVYPVRRAAPPTSHHDKSCQSGVLGSAVEIDRPRRFGGRQTLCHTG